MLSTNERGTHMSGRHFPNPGMFWSPGPRAFGPGPGGRFPSPGGPYPGPPHNVGPWNNQHFRPMGPRAFPPDQLIRGGFPGPGPRFNNQNNGTGLANNRGGFQNRKGQPQNRNQGQKRTFTDGGQNMKDKSTKKVKKVDKRDRTEYPFFCDTCDRGFKAADTYEEHVNGHQKCDIAGCSYVAAPKLVRLHVQLQHKTGFAKKIWSLESEEDLKKWIEDRKKNFPTAANIALKKAANQSKASRGEVLQTQDIRQLDKRGRQKNRRKNQHKDVTTPVKLHGEGGSKPHQMNSVMNKGNIGKSNQTTNSKTEDQEAKKTISNADPLSMVLGNNLGGSDDEQTGGTEAASPMVLASGLASLVACYGSSDEEEDDKPTDIIQSNSQQRNGQQPLPVISPAKPEGGAEEEKASDHTKHSRKKTRRSNSNKNTKTLAGVRKPSLLQKLLASEMRHERNVILQCVKYMVKKDFFIATKTDSSIE